MNEHIFQKFLDKANLRIQTSIVRSGISRSGDRYVCVVVVVHRKELPFIVYPRDTMNSKIYDKIEYEQYHCYELKGNKIVYDQGNQTKGALEGLLGFFGDEKEIHRYFESLCRKKAEEYFSKNENTIKKNNYIISESQYRFLTEIERTAGHHTTEPIANLLEYFNENLSREEKIESFREFFQKKVGYDKKIKKGQVISFFDSPWMDAVWPEEWTKKANLASFLYFLAKKYSKLKQGVDLEYMITKEKWSMNKEYFFFDPQLKICIGKINVKKLKEFPGKSYKVALSGVEEELIGTGYGTKMYLTVIEDVDYLASDMTLFSGAYRMWKHVLPKYVNVWGVYSKDGISQFEKLIPEKKTSARKFDFFIASSKRDLQR